MRKRRRFYERPSIYDPKKEKYKFKGLDRSVRDYVVSEKKAKTDRGEWECSLPLKAKVDTAQVDLGEAPILYKGKGVIPYLVLSFSYSNAFLFQVFSIPKS